MFLYLRTFSQRSISISEIYKKSLTKKSAILNSNFQNAFLYITPFVTQAYRLSHGYRLEKMLFTKKEIEKSEVNGFPK